jgi:Fe-S cluster biogenesis protein NfuA
MTQTVALDRDAVAGVVDDLSAMLAGDGAFLQLTGVDAGTVTIDLVLQGADCEDCVLPPAQLAEVVRGRLAAVPGFTALQIADPRTDEGSAATATPAAVPTQGGPALLTVLDPSAGIAVGDPDPGPPVGPLAGKRVGIRVDVLWPSFDWTVEEWTAELEQAGATVSLWRRAQGLKGAEGEAKQAEYDAFVTGVDVIVSGLGNCGSCTSWSVKDAISGLNNGLPSAVVVSEQFVTLATALSADYGRPNLHRIVLPGFLNTLPEQVVREAARDAFPTLLSALGATVGATA